MKILILLAAAAALPAFGAVITPINNSFETPAYAPGGYTNPYNLNTIDGWTFTTAGIAATGSPWFAGSPPDGSQAAFCQNACEISQSISGFIIGDPYAVSFYFADRSGYSPVGIEVFLGGHDLGAYMPVNGATNFVPVTTTSTIADATTMTLSFVGIYTGGDIDTAIDLVTIDGTAASVPEPSSVAGLLAAGVLGFFARRRVVRNA